MPMPSGETSSTPLRLFFALPCPPTITRQITTWRQTLAPSGQLVAPANLHLTLAFLGSQAASSLEQLASLAASIRLRAFELQLDRLECWPGGLLHLAPSHPPGRLLELAEQLRNSLLQHGYVQPAQSFRPHLTLARHSLLPTNANAPDFAWRVEHFALYASVDGDYQELECWPLILP